jgi:hypothetical protein
MMSRLVGGYHAASSFGLIGGTLLWHVVGGR